jgi:hypothetical protein
LYKLISQETNKQNAEGSALRAYFCRTDTELKVAQKLISINNLLHHSKGVCALCAKYYNIIFDYNKLEIM